MRHVTMVLATGLMLSALSVAPALAQAPEDLGFLVVEPAQGDLLTAIDLATSSTCTRGTMFAVTIAGPNLDDPDRGNLIGTTKIQTLGPESYPGHYVVPLPVDLATYISTTAPGQRIRGDYTIAFACRDRLSTADLQVFTAQIRIDGRGRYVARGESATPIAELIEGFVPGSTGVAIGDPPLPEPEEVAEVATLASPAESNASWRPMLVAVGVILLAGAAFAWWRSRRTSTETDEEAARVAG